MTNYYFMLVIFWLVIIRILLILIIYIIHPTIIIIILITYNIIICLNLSFNKSIIIYPILFFLIIIRGLLIIFLYFSRLISNEKNWLYIQNNLFIYRTLILILFIIIRNINYRINSPIMNSLELKTITNLNSLIINWSSTNLIYINPLITITLIRIIYLLITIITIIKISLPKILTLRKLN